MRSRHRLLGSVTSVGVEEVEVVGVQVEEVEVEEVEVEVQVEEVQVEVAMEKRLREALAGAPTLIMITAA